MLFCVCACLCVCVYVRVERCLHVLNQFFSSVDAGPVKLVLSQETEVGISLLLF